MGFNPQAARIGVGFCHGLALVMTIFRLWHRKRAGRLWWDDFYALLAAIFIIPLMATSLTWPIPTRKDPSLYIFWRLSALLSYTLCLWTSRISVGVTIVRLLPEGKLRKVAKCITGIFGVFCSALVLQKVFMCGSFARNKYAQCQIPSWIAPIELTTDLLGDLWLIGSPAYMLFNMKLPRNHRYLILAIFTSGIFTAAASVAHCIFIILKRPRAIGTSAAIQAAISLIVCNLLVVVTYIYRVFRDGDNSDSESADTESSRKERLTGSSGLIGSLANSSAVPMSTVVTLTD
ncbi:hypothetical protein BDQ12DRAFT_763373, partial [Crucibulum laeve]